VHEQLMAAAFVASPVRTPVVGWMNDLQAMTVEDARQWYERWYAPNNAVVVVAGDVDPGEVIRLAEQTYGRIANKTLPERKPQQEPAQMGLRRLEVKAPAENPSVVLAFKVPKLADVQSDREPYALEVLSAVLDADENGRLTRELVRGSRIANQANAGYDMTARGPVLFSLSGVPAQGQTTQALEQALRASVSRIAQQGVEPAELERVKTQYIAQRIYARDSIMAQAMEAGGLEMVGLVRADADRMLERIRAVTAEEVQAVAAKYFGDDTLTVVTLAPQKLASKPAAATAHEPR
jgi:zinc protease